MAMPSAFHRSTAIRALTVFSVLAVLVVDVGGYACPPFSCGGLSNISSPFRRQGDPPGCGVQSYELTCIDTKAIIHIGSGTYYVLSINYTDSTFWVVDTNLSMQSSCALPRWCFHARGKELSGKSWFSSKIVLAPDASEAMFNARKTIGRGAMFSTFVNCSRTIKNNGMYRPVACLSTNCSFIYVLTGEYSYSLGNLEPSCHYLAMTPLGGLGMMVPPENASYAEVVKFMRNGFSLQFPFSIYRDSCDFREWTKFARFVLVPLAIFTFLAHKYWKTKIRIDAVEKFLRMQQMICGPLRYAYTDITAITSHFREKLGQGGYGSVYKGVLPGNIHVAIKMLSNSKCNGEEFISEVSTIGRIHHVNVLRLVGFCSEEMRRALVYEYMPNGSLDKYIFSLEKSFSWDKLNEIAVGIARGINYLHQGCDMQILHFDIKPHNILLDYNFVPKVADFGLAKLFPRDKSFVPMSAMRGTVGYIAPEMVSRSFGVISSKSDVYSFGMLLLEMAGGRRNADPNVANSSQNYYPSWVYDRLIEQQVGKISDFNMHGLEKKLCIVGLWCIQMRSHNRPTMSEVIEMLESDINGLEIPSRPFFCDGGEQIPMVNSYYLSSELDDIQEDDK